MTITRRGFVAGLIAAPAIVRFQSIMPVKALDVFDASDVTFTSVSGVQPTHILAAGQLFIRTSDGLWTPLGLVKNFTMGGFGDSVSEHPKDGTVRIEWGIKTEKELVGAALGIPPSKRE